MRKTLADDLVVKCFVLLGLAFAFALSGCTGEGTNPSPEDCTVVRELNQVLGGSHLYSCEFEGRRCLVIRSYHRLAMSCDYR